MSKILAQQALLAFEEKKYPELGRLLEQLTLDTMAEESMKFDHNSKCLIQAVTGRQCPSPEHDEIENKCEEILEKFEEDKIKVSMMFERIMTMNIPLAEKIFYLFHFGKLIERRENEDMIHHAAEKMQKLFDQEAKINGWTIPDNSPLKNASRLLKFCLTSEEDMMVKILAKLTGSKMPEA